MKNIIATILVLGSIAIAVTWITTGMFAQNEYTNSISNYWTLADRASTISQKSDYIDKFVSVLDTSSLKGVHDALYFPTPENDFDSNLTALKSLQGRLHTIKTMDENSFAYQTAIQQITAQEQGQAKDMLGVFEGSWYKVNHYYLWNPWLAVLYFVSIFLLIGVGIGMFATGDSNY